MNGLFLNEICTIKVKISLRIFENQYQQSCAILPIAKLTNDLLFL